MAHIGSRRCRILPVGIGPDGRFGDSRHIAVSMQVVASRLVALCCHQHRGRVGHDDRMLDGEIDISRCHILLAPPLGAPCRPVVLAGTGRGIDIGHGHVCSGMERRAVVAPCSSLVLACVEWHIECPGGSLVVGFEHIALGLAGLACLADSCHAAIGGGCDEHSLLCLVLIDDNVAAQLCIGCHSQCRRSRKK